MTSIEVRSNIVEALRLDLIGPPPGHEFERELLPDPPSVWYLTGFLVPTNAPIEQKTDEDAQDELDMAGEGGGSDDNATPEKKAAKRSILPSSMGLTVLVPAGVTSLSVTVTWGDYAPEYEEEPADLELKAKVGAKEDRKIKGYRRRPRQESLTLKLPIGSATAKPVDVPNSGGLQIVATVRPMPDGGLGEGLAGARAVSLFLVNRRHAAPDSEKYRNNIFQARMAVECEGFVARPNLRGVYGANPGDLDERIADLQYRDVVEYAVGHGVSIKACVEAVACKLVETTWMPTAAVERVIPAGIPGVELRMEELGKLPDGAAEALLGSMVSQYRAWISEQKTLAEGLSEGRQTTAAYLVDQASMAANRIEAGIALLAQPKVLLAFQIANRTMARSARQRNWFTGGKRGTPAEQREPTWRPFQLAFLLMSLQGVVDPSHDDRELVDLLFFPTGGGKTEAYLGLSAFTMVYRRLQNPGPQGCGMSVLMRYTLRLLTLDQLSRAAGLMCALELERRGDPSLGLGEWPFEIGLWVGQAATPNRLGRQGDPDQHSAYHKVRKFVQDEKNPSPIPIEECPWCGTKFGRHSFRLMPHGREPKDLQVHCMSEHCEFNGSKLHLPILGVDEPIYRRLPAFLIATVDKFAALPWVGQTGALFGRVQRYDIDGFYGPCDPDKGRPLGTDLPGPDLIIQDELHLISGPLGTIAGIYEAAIDQLSAREVDGREVRPKIVASTATVRKAEAQIRALFDRRRVAVFPPPGVNRTSSFFALTKTDTEDARFYVGLAAQGRSLKVLLLRTALALLSASQVQYDSGGGKKNPRNPADPYMSLVGYFNSLRELGGSRRIVEDEIHGKLQGYELRRRMEPDDNLFGSRKIDFDVMELTSRVSTSRVADAKRRLSLPANEKGAVDVALATNMISVGLDIVRLGLMLVFGQPKTSAEYIQATSRVGRDPERPGLVVTLLNVHKPRDRSHYERFESYHRSFYRAVEATSITPFSPRALDRALPAALISLCRHAELAMTPALGADGIATTRHLMDRFAQRLGERAKNHRHPPDPTQPGGPETLKSGVINRCTGLLDDWVNIAAMVHPNTRLQYAAEVQGGAVTNLLYTFLDSELANVAPVRKRFRANRSMREVESVVELEVKPINEWEPNR